MALYIGSSEKLSVVLEGKKLNWNFYSTVIPVFSGVLLKTADDRNLLDANGFTLTAKEEL